MHTYGVSCKHINAQAYQTFSNYQTHHALVVKFRLGRVTSVDAKSWIQAFKNASKAWQDEQPEVHLSAEDLGALEVGPSTSEVMLLRRVCVEFLHPKLLQQCHKRLGLVGDG